MAVFWFGWTKKLKNIFTKKEADALYLQKGQTGLQVVNSLVDFKNNIVCKQNGYVDNVDTNAPTSMINKRYFDNAINSIQVGRSIKVGNTVFQTESKNIAADTPTSYLPASGFSISNLEVGKLYMVVARWSTGSYVYEPIFYQGSNGVQIYLAWIDTAISFGRSSNNLLVRANKAVNNISISFKEVIITN